MSRTCVISLPRGCAFALSVLALGAPAAAPAQLAPDRGARLDQQRVSRRQQYQSTQQSVSQMPPSGARTLDDVFHLKTDGRHLALESSIAENGDKVGSFRVEVPQFRGPASVTVQTVSFQRAWRDPAPVKVAGPNPAGAFGGVDQVRTFSFNSQEMPDDDSLVAVSVMSQPAYLHIQRSVQSGEVNRTVQIIQQRLSDAVRGPNAATLTLTVSEFNPTIGRVQVPPRPPVNLTLQVTDFHTLLRQHPREVEEHVRPLLRAVGQESVFAPDEVVAWQVFSGRWKPDSKVVEKVRSILPSLDHADYRVRERAVRDLMALGKPGAAAMMSLDHTGFSAERNLLIDRALVPFAQLKPKEAERLRSDTRFLLDCLYSDDADVRAAALEALKKTAGADVAFDVKASAPDRAAAVSVLQQKLLPDPATNAAPASQPAKS
jgi:hypothetical protein